MDPALPLDDELVSRARKGRRDAVVQVLAAHYGLVWRMSAALAGSEEVGKSVTRFVMQRSLRVLGTWKDAAAPTRWFQHHTLLATRRLLGHRNEPERDSLLPSPPSSAQAAFIRALRALPMQQREALILATGEQMSPRALAVAMDCSIVAAETHLAAARASLNALSIDDYPSRLAEFRTAYAALVPSEALTISDVRRRVDRLILPWRVKRIGRIIAMLVLAAAIVCFCYWTCRIIDHSLPTRDDIIL